ncbi:MaoC/PaaZ C-terminal domain-containing protein [Amycolatopsis ultiminotia]|uniref:MaoC/PaaZ C-terminal domain-containing protein n=1 Tax=Amycolatopsis ultiminotia TaxID=543629 RepID=A0ABP6XI39_9PSEU
MTAHELRLPAVSRRTLADFATASGDRNALHLDGAAARRAGFDDVIAHGMLGMAYLGRLVTTLAPQSRVRSLRALFVAPIPLGASPCCTARLVARQEDGSSRFALAVTIENGRTVIRGEATILPEEAPGKAGGTEDPVPDTDNPVEPP